MKTTDYWKECIAEAASECGLSLTEEQLETLAGAVEVSYENYGMAYYSPPSTDRISEIEREHKQKVKALESEHDKYRQNAETAIKEALNVHSDESVSLGEYGEVFAHGGRTTRIQ